MSQVDVDRAIITAQKHVAKFQPDPSKYRCERKLPSTTMGPAPAIA